MQIEKKQKKIQHESEIEIARYTRYTNGHIGYAISVLYFYTFWEILKKSKQVCLTAASADQNITTDQQQRKLKADKAMTVYRIYRIGTAVGMRQ